MTPREVNRRYSKGRDFEVVLRNGYRKRGICAIKVRKDLLLQGGVCTIQEECPGLIMGCNALQKSQCIAHSV